ncbi:response regulator [Anaerolineales bacterium HSG25]|nr:response regulator [Anaerolineales bacterium HSG25]
MSNLPLLVIDDEADDILSELHNALTDEGYEVDLAKDGNKGWNLFQQKLHPIVITDLRMPKSKDGLEVLADIKQMWPQTQVIIITGHGRKDDAIKSLKLHAFDYIEKGGSNMLPDLLDAVARAVQEMGLIMPDMPNTLPHSLAEVRAMADQLPFSISDEINMAREETR